MKYSAVSVNINLKKSLETLFSRPAHTERRRQMGVLLKSLALMGVVKENYTFSKYMSYVMHEYKYIQIIRKTKTVYFKLIRLFADYQIHLFHK